jgi:hypothetical protein
MPQLSHTLDDAVPNLVGCFSHFKRRHGLIRRANPWSTAAAASKSGCDCDGSRAGCCRTIRNPVFLPSFLDSAFLLWPLCSLQGANPKYDRSIDVTRRITVSYPPATVKLKPHASTDRLARVGMAARFGCGWSSNYKICWGRLYTMTVHEQC